MLFRPFEYSDGFLQLNKPEILLHKEFEAIVNDPRNKTKQDPTGSKQEWSWVVFKYLYLSEDFKSDFYAMSSYDKELYSTQDSNISEEDRLDPLIQLAKNKYKFIVESDIVIRLLQSSYVTVNGLIDLFNNPQYTATDPNGKYVNSAKDAISNLSNLNKVHEGLRALEFNVKKEMETQKAIRGDATPGFMDTGRKPKQ